MAQVDLVVRGALWQGREVDLLVAKGKILECLPYDESREFSSKRQLEGFGLRLFPSFIDAHVHLREPGFEYKENVASGLKAAAHSGFGAVLAMANTQPVNDSATVTELMLDRAKQHWPKGPRVHPVGALTKGLQGKELAPLMELAEAGCAAFSNDGLPVASTELFRRGMEYASDLGRLVIDHCEDPSLAVEGVMNESELSGHMGLVGVPTVSESIQVARDILLAGYLNKPIHLAHIGSRESVELIAWAKEKGIPVTAETCPHYLLLTEDAVKEYDANAKMNPPLRREDDVEAVRQGLRTGVLDILVTDHAPHARHEKETCFADAPNGITGLDTAVALTWSLVEQGVLDESRFIEAWCFGPGKIFNLPVNSFQPGDPADFFLFDEEEAWEVSASTLHSKGKNSPWLGKMLHGRVRAHCIAGKTVV
ncbi:MAG: dihydroorotase [Desulfovibrio sp.]|nr:MAG: dihydroorotase [Desulfovibrio sp.]